MVEAKKEKENKKEIQEKKEKLEEMDAKPRKDTTKKEHKEKQTKGKEEKVDVKMKEKKYAIRGNIIEGIVVSAKANKTIIVACELTHYVPKYERYKKVTSKIKAHNPESINAKEGDKVRIGETRKISKTKNFIVMKILSDKKWRQWQ